MWPELISAGASLLGGIFGQNSERRNNEYQAQLIREQNAYNAPIKVRERAEQAGLNPLLFMGPGVGQQMATAASSSSNYMGNAIADAGLIMADAVAKRKDAMRLSRMEDQNRRLTDKVQSLTLRPQVGGIYAQLQQTPTIASALGVRSALDGRQGVGVAASAAGGVGGAVDTVAPIASNTFSVYTNDGASTEVPLGPDIDEIISGAMIAANNRDKARRAREARSPGMTYGKPLSMRDGIEMPPSYKPKYPKPKWEWEWPSLVAPMGGVLMRKPCKACEERRLAIKLAAKKIAEKFRAKTIHQPKVKK